MHVGMGLRRNFAGGRQRKHFAHPCQVADDAMLMYVHETLDLFSVVYAESFHGEDFIQWHWWSFVFGTRYLWRHNLKSHSCFQTNVLWSLLTWHAYSPTHTPLNLCAIALNINYQRSRLGFRLKINSTLRHSSSLLQKYQAARYCRGVKHTHHLIRAIYNCKMRLR